MKYMADNFKSLAWNRTKFLLPYLVNSIFFKIGIVGGGVQLDPLGTAVTNRPIGSAPSVYDDGEIGRMIGRGNRSTRRKPAPVPLCPPQIPHAARKRTRAATVGIQRLTASATALPSYLVSSKPTFLYQRTQYSIYGLNDELRRC
jgi:hypothetical protein